MTSEDYCARSGEIICRACRPGGRRLRARRFVETRRFPSGPFNIPGPQKRGILRLRSVQARGHPQLDKIQYETMATSHLRRRTEFGNRIRNPNRRQYLRPALLLRRPPRHPPRPNRCLWSSGADLLQPALRRPAQLRLPARHRRQHLPYIASITAPTEHHFTGKERDAESGNDYFGARYYSSAMGRFMSPDWSAKVKPVPYAKLDEPQTLNLYAYVGNNPMTRYDADGHKHKTEEQKEIDNQKVRMGEQKTINQAQDLGVLVLSSPGACTTFLDNHVPGSAVNGFRNMSFFLDRDDTPGNGDAAKITGVNDPRAYAFINPNGAFFHSSTIVNDQENHIHGMYDLALVLNNKDLTGGTMKAKLVIMFHEYAHKIGLFPAERTSSPKLHHDDSIDNNQRTWDACKDQLKNIK